MKRLIIFALLLASFALSFSPVLAQSGTVNTGGSGITLTNPLGDVTSPQAFIGKIINSILGVVGSLALLMFVYGGLTWMTSSGSADKVKKGRDTLLWAAIGLVVIFSAYGLTRFILGTVVTQ
ncbi:MAG: pilin [Patescibacteria group bacterium]|jgi:hypothetical protein